MSWELTYQLLDIFTQTYVMKSEIARSTPVIFYVGEASKTFIQTNGMTGKIKYAVLQYFEGRWWGRVTIKENHSNFESPDLRPKYFNVDEGRTKIFFFKRTFHEFT